MHNSDKNSETSDLKKRMIDAIKEDLPKATGEFKEKLLRILANLESDNIKNILDEAVIDFNSNYFQLKPEKGRQSAANKIDEIKFEWLVRGHKIYMDPDGPRMKYSTQKARDTRIEKLTNKMLKVSHELLAKQYANTIIDFEFALQDRAALLEETIFLAEYVRKVLGKRLETVQNQTKGKDEKFQSNNDCMDECLKEVLESKPDNKPLTKAIYRKFIGLVIKKYPKPPVLQKLRQNKAEKSQDKGMQEADLEALERSEWAPTTLRNFFERKLKVKVADLP